MTTPELNPRGVRIETLFDGDGYEYECPQCEWRGNLDDCDVLGADPGCVFCPECEQEFET